MFCSSFDSERNSHAQYTIHVLGNRPFLHLCCFYLSNISHKFWCPGTFWLAFCAPSRLLGHLTERWLQGILCGWCTSLQPLWTGGRLHHQRPETVHDYRLRERKTGTEDFPTLPLQLLLPSSVVFLLFLFFFFLFFCISLCVINRVDFTRLYNKKNKKNLHPAK